MSTLVGKLVGKLVSKETKEELVTIRSGDLEHCISQAMGYYSTYPDFDTKLCRMPSVCTARIIASLGTAENTYRDCEHQKRAVQMTKEIKSWINYCKEYYNLAYLMATTSSDQVEGAKALEAAGFICTHNVVNKKYPDTYLKTWMYFFNGEVPPEQLAEFGE